MEHAGESAVQVSVGVEMEAYGDQAAAASNQCSHKSREEPSRKSCDHQHQWYNWQGKVRQRSCDF